MANPEHLSILKRGVQAWNEWREENSRNITAGPRLDLRDADLSRSDLNAADLSRADLNGANLTNSTMLSATLGDNDLSVVKGLEAPKTPSLPSSTRA